MFGTPIKIMVTCIALANMVSAAVWTGNSNTNWLKNNNDYINYKSFNISTPEELARLSELVNSGKDFSGKTINLKADLFLNDTTKGTNGKWPNKTDHRWEPIGTPGHQFKGTFDGNNYKIFGLYTRSTTYGARGLFGSATGAKIQNVHLVGGSAYSYISHLGAILGEGTNTTIENVTSSVAVFDTSTASSSTKYSVGGLVGHLSGSIISCSVNANVTGKDSVGGLAGTLIGDISSSNYNGNVKGSNMIGGLVGFVKGNVESSTAAGKVSGYSSIGGLIGKGDAVKDTIRSTIISSSAKSEVEGQDSVGGLVGYFKGNIQSSSFDGKVSGRHNIGGIVGKLIGKITGNAPTSCSFSGTVKGNSLYYFGGIAGKADSVLNICADGYVFVSTGRYVGGIAGEATYIQNSFHINNEVEGQDVVGGVAGQAKTIKDSYHENGLVSGRLTVGGVAGSVTDSIVNSHADCYVAGQGRTGGLVASGNHIVGSYAKGTITGTGAITGGLAGAVSGTIKTSLAMGTVTGRDSVGGLVGQFTGTKIDDSYSETNVEGTEYVGGIAGIAKGTFTRTYARKKVTGSSNYGCIAGGAITKQSLSSTQTYYDKDSCTASNYTTSGSTATSLSQIAKSYPFSSWDFNKTWVKVSGSYPLLMTYARSVFSATISIANASNIVYNGSEQKPSVTVKSQGTTWSSSNYTVKYTNNTNVGTASAIVCGVSPYSGCKAETFEIKPNTTAPTIEITDTNLVYNGYTQTPSIKVTLGSQVVNSSQYSVSYSNNVNAGTASVTVTMKGGYSGKATKQFTIKKAPTSAKIRPTASDIISKNTLSASTLKNGSAVRSNTNQIVAGQFKWVTPTTVPAFNNSGYPVEFIPSSSNYEKSDTIMIPIKVLASIVVLDINKNLLDSFTVEYNSKYKLPEPPVIPGKTFWRYQDFNTGKAYSPNYNITATENARFQALYNDIYYTIRFMNGSTVLENKSYRYEITPYYSGTTPTNEEDTLYTYEFVGWSPAIEKVTKDQDYKAVFNKILSSGAIKITEEPNGHRTATINGEYTDNDAFEINNSIDVDEVSFTRQFSTNGYSTLMLPFNVNTANLTGIDSVLSFAGIVLDTNKKKAVSMEVVWAKSKANVDLKANTPYMVKMNSKNLGISGSVTLLPTQNLVTEKDGWEFRGTNAYITWNEGNKDLCRVYGFAAGSNDSVSVGQFVKFGAGAKLRPMRAYLINTNVSCSDAPLMAPKNNFAARPAIASIDETPDQMDIIIVDDEDGEEHTTVIGRINTRTGEIKMLRNYDLKGRNVQGKTKTHGAYYGKKVVK